MSEELSGADFNQGIAIAEISDGAMVLGHADGEPVLLARRGAEIFAIGARCTHYGAPLEQGLMVDDTVRCPWHHACFSLRTGAALRAPALDPVACFRVEQRDGKVYTRGKQPSAKPAAPPANPEPVIIIGGGAAGEAAAEMLRREGYEGRLTMFSADADLPPDRPKLSKGFLNGSSEADEVPLRPGDFYAAHRIDLRLGTAVRRIDPEARLVTLADGSDHPYGALLLATGAAPKRLDVPGDAQVHYLRSVADSRALVAKAKPGARAVVIGSSFIGLEVAASLRKRDVAVAIVTPEAVPMAKLLGPEVGAHFRALHEQHGVVFYAKAEVARVEPNAVILKDGQRIEADFIVAGIGVQPLTELAAQAGLATDRGVSVNEYLETSAPGIFAAGDIARWPDPHSGQAIRVEHWVVAQRQGQVAARNMLGYRERFDQAPFFWTIQYEFGLGYVGHAEHWDEILFDGSLEENDCTITYRHRGKALALAIVQRNLDGLRFEHELERGG